MLRNVEAADEAASSASLAATATNVPIVRCMRTASSRRRSDSTADRADAAVLTAFDWYGPVVRVSGVHAPSASTRTSQHHRRTGPSAHAGFASIVRRALVLLETHGLPKLTHV